MKVCLTIDMESDCPPYLTGYRGVEEGTPRLLSLLEREKIPATFFTTGDVARRYPATIKTIVAMGHELACHGDSHCFFTDMDDKTAECEIREASEVLRKFYPVISFRAPNLKFPRKFVPFLEKNGYRLDSSQAKYKPDYWWRVRGKSEIKRIPASVTSSVLRLPRLLRYSYFHFLKSPIVFFVHPWEFVDLSHEPIRFDCRFRTGKKALDCLQKNITYYKKRGARFLPIKDFVL